MLTTALFYGCAVHAAGFFMPRGMKLFAWIIIGLTGAAALLSPAWPGRPAQSLDHLADGRALRRAAPGLRRVPVRHGGPKETGVNPKAFLDLDRTIHEKGRLAIMSMLAATTELSFTELRDTLEMTDGNLTTHVRTLQEAGYVSVAKSYRTAGA